MKRQRLTRAQRSARHSVIRKLAPVSTPLRRALEAVVTPRLNGSLHWECPTISESAARLTGGRVKQFTMRYWINGGRSAPAWFVAVLREQVLQRRAKLDAVLADLDRYQPLDRAQRSREQSARARRIMAEGKGAIGQRIARKRQEALEREQRLRAIYPPQGENNAPAGAGVANAAEKTTPTIDR